MTIITLKELKKFEDFLNDNINRNEYKYKFLVYFLDTLFVQQKGVIKQNSSIIWNGDNWAIFIETNKELLFYCKYYERIFADKILEQLDLNQHLGKEIVGDYDLIYELLRKNKIKNFKVIKDRLFYKTETVNKISNSKHEIASEFDLEKVIQLYQEYYKEEYKGARNKTKDNLYSKILRDLKNKRIYIIKDDGEIVAFCSINNPDIGIMFTDKKNRKLGYSKQLLSIATERLLSGNLVAYVMTDMHNIPSNKVCRDIGYNIYYKHTYLSI